MNAFLRTVSPDFITSPNIFRSETGNDQHNFHHVQKRSGNTLRPFYRRSGSGNRAYNGFVNIGSEQGRDRQCGGPVTLCRLQDRSDDHAIATRRQIEHDGVARAPHDLERDPGRPDMFRSQRLFPRFLRQFGRNRRGSAAVEFALVAPVLFALLFAILETGTMFFAGQVLQTVAQELARTILTGHAQLASYTQSQFATYVCNQVPTLFTCSNISIDVESYPSFSSVRLSNPIDNNGNFIRNNLQYSLGCPGDIVTVRLFYQWPLFVTGLG